MPVHAITYFSQQYATMKQSASRTNSKSSVLPMETQRAAGDGAPPRKRGRRSGRQTSQDTPSANLPSQEISAYEAAITAAFQTGMLEAQQNMSNSTLPLSYLKNVATANPGTSANPSYPTMNIDPLKAVRNPGMNMKHIEQANKTLKSTMSAEDFSKSTKMNPIPSSSYALTNPTKPNSMVIFISSHYLHLVFYLVRILLYIIIFLIYRTLRQLKRERAQAIMPRPRPQ